MGRFAPTSSAAAGRRVLASAALVVAIALTPPSRSVQAQEVMHALGALLDGSGFVPIPAGEFLMGSTNGTAAEGPVHRVRLSKGFEIGKFEVTQAQWEAVMGTAHPSMDPEKGAKAEPAAGTNPSHFKGPALPVENVSWNTVQQFLIKLNARDPTHVYRLPTEAEWEYASRAGRNEDAPGNLNASAWFEANSSGQTQPVGQKQPNAWGVYDMQGNVSEWVDDWFGLEYYEESPAVDPPGPQSGSYRVYRGCGWFGSAADCQSALRSFNFPGDGYYNVGFRLARTAR